MSLKETLKLKKKADKLIAKRVTAVLNTESAKIFSKQDSLTKMSCVKVVKALATKNQVSIEKVAMAALDLADKASKEYA